MAGVLPQIAAAFVSAEPADVTFVDGDGVVRYFSEYRIFSRPASCLDRDALLCHREESRPGVAQLLAEFRDGWRDDACFVSQKDGRNVDVRYSAVRDTGGSYVGCLEVARWAEPNAGD